MKRYQVEYSTKNEAYKEEAKMWRVIPYCVALIVILSLLS